VSIAPSEMERQPVYLDARMAPGTSSVLITEAELLASDVATTMDAMLKTPNSPLASLAANMKYYSVPAELIVVARRRGEMSWRGVSLSGDSSAYAILAIALDSARHDGSAVMLWPEGLTDDSLVIRLTLLPRDVRDPPVALPGEKAPRSFLAFALPRPRITPPTRLSEQFEYMSGPHIAHSERVSGVANLSFVIDTSGRVDMSTFHDVWPADKPRLTGTYGAYYEQLLGRMKAFEANASFSAGKIGSCKIPVVVHETFTFDGTHSTDRYSKW
jgi:hypothetical protein